MVNKKKKKKGEKWSYQHCRALNLRLWHWVNTTRIEFALSLEVEFAQRVNYTGLMGVSIGWVSHIMLLLNLNALPLTLLKWWPEVNTLRLTVRAV